MHNPNPFDFVPFPEQPKLFTKGELEKDAVFVTGYLELRLKTLTPLHIVGAKSKSGKTGSSTFYMQDGKPCVPAATIRGCLRSFLEALTAGWLSQVNEIYEKVPGKTNKDGRHVGFKLFEQYPKGNTSVLSDTPNVVGTDYKAKNRDDGKIDVSSYLFGIVTEKEEKDTEPLALKSKIWVEDAFFDKKEIQREDYWYPDLAGNAFMGGGKPNISNWWYFEPREIWNRRTRITYPDGRQGIKHFAEFIGGKLRGRKFYFHQKPEGAMNHYQYPGGKWQYSRKNPFCRIRMEAIPEGKGSETFKLYFDRVPKQLLALIVLALFPGQTIRHKIGYGKAYGYGSIELELISAYYREYDPKPDTVPALLNVTEVIENWRGYAWDPQKIQEELGIDHLVDCQALNQLAVILGWDEVSSKTTCTYPPFNSGNFKNAIQWNELTNNREIQQILRTAAFPHKISVSPRIGKKIAGKLSNTKRTIDFRFYQENARNWREIAGRKP